MEEQTTLENFWINPNRRSGNTIRQVDHAIQIIFSGKECIVKDHARNGEDNRINKELFNKVMDRIFNEHYPQEVSIDVKKLSIKLK